MPHCICRRGQWRDGQDSQDSERYQDKLAHLKIPPGSDSVGAALSLVAEPGRDTCPIMGEVPLGAHQTDCRYIRRRLSDGRSDHVKHQLIAAALPRSIASLEDRTMRF